MDIEDSDEEEQPLNDSFIDITELKKVFSAHDFARSLLPDSNDRGNDETESTFYGEFLDDLERKVENNDISTVETNYFEALRTWSNVKFKKQPPVAEDVSSEVEQQLEVDMLPSEVSKENGGSHITNILTNFLEEEKKSTVYFSNLNLQSETLDLPFIKSATTGKKFFRFYYLDAYEKLFGEESSVYLFGKTYCHLSKSYKSCCVAVRPLKRRLFILPRICAEVGQDISLNETRILKEFYKLALKPLNIPKFKYRFVKKRSIEGLFLSEDQTMLEIEYSAYYPTVNPKLEGATFYKVFGTNDNCFQNFLLEKHIKGPCWLDVSNAKRSVKTKTWCRFEVSCTTEEISLCKLINKSASPPLTLLSFHLRTVDRSNKVALISWAVNFNYGIWSDNSSVVEEESYCTFAFVNCDEKPTELGEIFKNLRRTLIQSMSSEKDLLIFFLKEFHKVDPDIIVGYDIQNEEFHKFIDRLESLKIEGRSKLSKFIHTTSNSETRKFVLNGRLICDLRVLAREFALARNYELNELFEIFLGIKKEFRCTVHFGEMISSTGIFHNIVGHQEKFLELFVMSSNEPIQMLKLALKTNILSLAFKLTEISGNTLSQTFSGSISKRIEFFLLHAFHEQNFILPNKMFNRKHKDLDEEILAGGLVLEPKAGFYNNYILLMDFQSLYPSIIHEYNLCISRNKLHQSDGAQEPLAVLPKLMSQLIENRKKVKDEMNIMDHSSTAHFRYQIYQTALKLSANGIYGCLASPYFRFYCPSVAQDITRIARGILGDAVHLLERNGFEIIYGDTDSMMVNTKSKNISTVLEMGQEIRKLVNAQYSSVNLKIDTIFETLLIIAKKKYAGISVNIQHPEMQGERILKGLDIIRYDRPSYVCQVGKRVVDVILSNFSPQEKCEEIKRQLSLVKEDLLNNKIPMEWLVVTKYLTQDPKNYSLDTSCPHVQVAIRCNQNYLFNFKSGDAVSFIMCSDKSKTSSQKAYHLEEVKNSQDLVIDGAYYLRKQIYPFVKKLSVHVGLTPLDIERCLCLKNPPEEIEQFKFNKIEFERRDPFIFNCLKCGKSNILDKNDEAGVLLKCLNVECDYCPLDNLSYLKNRLTTTVISYIRKYYKYELKCTNMHCSYITLKIPLSYTKEKNICPECGNGRVSQIYNEVDLFLQIEYFKYILKYGLCEYIHDDCLRNPWSDLIHFVVLFESYNDNV